MGIALRSTFWVSVLLILVGLIGRYVLGMRGGSSVLPLVLGMVLGVLGCMAVDTEYAGRVMLVVALLSLLGVLGTLDLLVALAAWLDGRPLEAQTAELFTRGAMLLLCGTLLLVCVGSAIGARLRRRRA
jgi:hypothetical protein